MKEYYIYFEGVISLKTTQKIIEAINKATEKKFEKIIIFLSSWGGNIDNGFLLASIIQNSPIPVSIHATNHIDSIANVIYMSAKERTAESYAKFFMHGASQGGDNYDEKKLKEALSGITASNTRIAYFISENCKVELKVEEVLNIMGEGTTISAQDALNMGIVSQILHKEIPLGAERENIIDLDIE